MLAVRRFRGGTMLLSREAWALITALFFCYWLPELFSAIDAVDTRRAWREVLLDLRYLPFLWLAGIAVAQARGRRVVFTGIGVIALLWVLDAGVQAITGYSLGGANSSDRLSGIFGADNLKLGLVLASLSPFALEAAAQRFHAAGWILTAVGFGLVILLAGSRASWLVYALVMLLSGWRRIGRKRLLASMVLGVAIAMEAFSFRTAIRESRGPKGEASWPEFIRRAKVPELNEHLRTFAVPPPMITIGR